MVKNTVSNAATLGRNGIHDFLLIRASAIILALYSVYLFGFVIFNDISYQVWADFFSCTLTQVFTLLALLAMVVHAWIGLWQVLTDYIKPAGVRLFLQFGLNVIAFIYLLTGTVILWGL